MSELFGVVRLCQDSKVKRPTKPLWDGVTCMKRRASISSPGQGHAYSNMSKSICID